MNSNSISTQMPILIIPLTVFFSTVADATDTAPDEGGGKFSDDSARNISVRDYTTTTTKGKRKRNEDTCIVEQSKSL